MKILGGLTTFIIGVLLVLWGMAETNYFLIGVGLIIVYTGYRVLRAKPNN